MTATIPRPYSLNASSLDYVTENGSRVSCPVYVDVTMIERKALLNAIRQVCYQPSTTQVKSISGITVENSASKQQEVESFLGCSIDVLRSVLFQRGGLPVDLILRIQSVSGYEVISLKDLDAGLKSKLNNIKEFSRAYSFDSDG
jgi:hypothetical protein